MKAKKANVLALGAALLSSMVLGGPVQSRVGVPRGPAQAAAPAATSSITSSTSAATQRAILDQYCVTCHNDKTRRANLSLEKLDLTTVAEHGDLWEKVIRKLRAGVMPPPGMRRPPVAE